MVDVEDFGLLPDDTQGVNLPQFVAEKLVVFLDVASCFFIFLPPQTEIIPASQMFLCRFNPNELFIETERAGRTSAPW